MNKAKSLKTYDQVYGTGPEVTIGDVVAILFTCRKNRGDILWAWEDEQHPSIIRVGVRDYVVAVEQGIVGMKAGGIRAVVSPPNLNHQERKIFPDLPRNSVLNYQIKLIRIIGRWK